MKTSPILALTISAILSSGAIGQIVVDGDISLDDNRLYAWYDGNEALGADGVAETPVWPNKQGDELRDIANGFVVDPWLLEPVEVGDGSNMGLRFENAVTWAEAGNWGFVEDSFTVFVAATVRDPDFAFFFTGNQGGGGAEGNGNFQTEELDVWSIKGQDRIDTGEIVVDEFQVHTFIYNAEEGSHYIDGTLAGEGEIGFASMEGFVLGGRQNGGQRASVDFGEVIVYDAALNTADRESVEQYLSNKFFGGASLPGDFDNSGTLDSIDIDLLSEQVEAGTNDASFDLNDDAVVNQDDRDVWVEVLRGTYFGDSNFDGEFNSSDFVAVFGAGEYEDTTVGNSTWATGDWNGDKEFDSSDFVKAFQGAGYEIGPRTPAAVPEPRSLAATAILCGLMLFRSRRRI